MSWTTPRALPTGSPTALGKVGNFLQQSFVLLMIGTTVYGIGQIGMQAQDLRRQAKEYTEMQTREAEAGPVRTSENPERVRFKP